MARLHDHQMLHMQFHNLLQPIIKNTVVIGYKYATQNTLRMVWADRSLTTTYRGLFGIISMFVPLGNMVGGGQRQ